MTTILGNPRFQSFLQDKVTFNDMGSVEAYEAGSTPSPSNKKNVYGTVLDALTQNNPLTNPVLLDSSGQADIVCQGPTLIIVKDKNGNILSTTDFIDNVTDDPTDPYGNLVVKYLGVPEAVNYFEMSSSATGDPILLNAAGADTNVSMSINSKGTGKININNLETGTLNNTGNITSTGSITSTDSTTGFSGKLKGFVYPSADGSRYSILRTDGSKNLVLSNNLPSFTAARQFPTDNQTITTATETKIFYSNALVNKSSIYNTSTSAFLAPVTGIYAISAFLRLGSMPSGSSAQLSLRKNGSLAVFPFSSDIIYYTATTTESVLKISTVCIPLTLNDIVHVSFLHTTGSNLSLNNINGSFSAYLIEPGT